MPRTLVHVGGVIFVHGGSGGGQAGCGQTGWLRRMGAAGSGGEKDKGGSGGASGLVEV